MLNCLGFAPGSGKSRYVRDVRIKCFCPSEELLPHVRPYETGEVVCVFVLEVKKESQRLLVGMKSDAIKDEVARAKLEKSKIPLGLCRDQQDLPILFDYAEQVLKKKLTYSEVLAKNKGFENPSNVEVLTEELGLSNTAGVSSLFPNLQYESVSSTILTIFCIFSVHILVLGSQSLQRLPAYVKLKPPKWPFNTWPKASNTSKTEMKLKLCSVLIRFYFYTLQV